MSYTKEIEFKIPFEYDDINDQQRRAVEHVQGLADDTVESFTEPWERETVWERHQDGGFHKMVRFTSEFTYLGDDPDEVRRVRMEQALQDSSWARLDIVGDVQLRPLPDDNSLFGRLRARRGRA